MARRKRVPGKLKSTPDTRYISQSRYAEHIGKSRGWVSKLKSANALIMKDSLVDWEASDMALDEIEKAKVNGNKGRTLANEYLAKKEQVAKQKKQVQGKSVDLDGNELMSFDAARELKENYQARMAKVKFEEVEGRLVDRKQVERDSFQAGKAVTDKVMALPVRLSAILAAELDGREIERILTEELENALSDASIKIEVTP